MKEKKLILIYIDFLFNCLLISYLNLVYVTLAKLCLEPWDTRCGRRVILIDDRAKFILAVKIFSTKEHPQGIGKLFNLKFFLLYFRKVVCPYLIMPAPSLKTGFKGSGRVWYIHALWILWKLYNVHTPTILVGVYSH